MVLHKILIAFLAIGGLMLSSCTHQATAVRLADGAEDEEAAVPAPEGMRILRSAQFEGGLSGQGQTAHVSVRDGTAHAGNFKKRLVRKLKERGFAITEQPSRADRIVAVEILSRRTAQPQSLEASVERGYGSKTGLVQGTGSAVIADVLVVRRRVPSEKKDDLRNITARNALSSSKVRFGLVSDDSKDLATHGFEEALAGDIASLAAADRDQEVHRTRSTTEMKPEKKARKKASKKKKGKSSSKKKKAKKAKD